MECFRDIAGCVMAVWESSAAVSGLCVTAAIGMACLFATGVGMAVRKRERKGGVSCWFCDQKQPSTYPDSGWTCVACQQYNGFTEVGV